MVLQLRGDGVHATQADCLRFLCMLQQKLLYQSLEHTVYRVYVLLQYLMCCCSIPRMCSGFGATATQSRMMCTATQEQCVHHCAATASNECIVAEVVLRSLNISVQGNSVSTHMNIVFQ
jgi:hypothetical protein